MAAQVGLAARKALGGEGGGVVTHGLSVAGLTDRMGCNPDAFARINRATDRVWGWIWAGRERPRSAGLAGRNTKVQLAVSDGFPTVAYWGMAPKVREEMMAWKKPTAKAIACGMEINMYGPSEDDRRPDTGV